MFFRALLLSVAAGLGSASSVPLTTWSLGQGGDAKAASLPSFTPTPPTWAPVTVPCTVLACQLQNGLYPDLYNDQNIYAGAYEKLGYWHCCGV